MKNYLGKTGALILFAHGIGCTNPLPSPLKPLELVYDPNQDLRWKNFTISAYAPACTHMNNNGKMEPSKYNLTKLGIPPIYDKTVAVDPKVIPLGSTVKIAGVGTFLAADTGKLIKGTRIDIAVADCEEAIQFGKQNMKVRIVKGEWK